MPVWIAFGDAGTVLLGATISIRGETDAQERIVREQMQTKRAGERPPHLDPALRSPLVDYVSVCRRRAEKKNALKRVHFCSFPNRTQQMLVFSRALTSRAVHQEA